MNKNYFRLSLVMIMSVYAYALLVLSAFVASAGAQSAVSR
jgi:hypothetical protein